MSSSNVTSVTSHFSQANEGFTTTTSGSVSSGGTTIGLNSVSGLTNASVFVGIIEPDTVNEQTFTGVVDTSGSQLTNVVWTRGTNVLHAGGVTVVDYVTGTSHNMMTKGILVAHNQDGTHKSGAVYTLPTIADFTNATHTHVSSATGGALTVSAMPTGMTIQTVQTDYSADTSGTTVIPADNTIPQVGEGFEVMSQSITPTSATSVLLVEYHVLANSAGVNNISAAVFRDGAANAIQADISYNGSSAGDQNIMGSIKVTAGSTASTTFTVRIGPDASQTVTFGSGRFSTAPHSHIRVTEIKA